MKFSILTGSIILFFGIGFLQLKPTLNNTSHALRPEENYFLTTQHGHEGEGIDIYKNAMLTELKKLKKTRTLGSEWRNEGPFDIGGRINCIAVHPTQSATIMVGCADGGIFKTDDGGNNWYPVFDNSIALSISSIEYDKTNPNILYAGTGDQVVGGYSHMGNGIYKSMDGGNTWNHLGLAKVGTICKIIIDPNNSNTMYVGTTGNIFISDNNRGMYKTTDGGATWTNVLFLGQNAGIGDMVIHPTNASIIYATGRRRLRSNQQSIITGPEARIYKSTNGGSTWDTLTNGLPIGSQSRIGLAISKNNPNLLYALYVDSANLDFGGLYKSTNGGNSWSLATNTGITMGGFGWYFGEIRLDPNNDQTVFVLSVHLHISTDGGNSFITEYITHADKHDLKFVNASEVLLATDGGFYKSSNAGGSWVQYNNLPITQFYETAHNPFDSLNYYGGAQDNGTNYGSKQQGLNNWIHYYGGDGFRPQFSKNDEFTLYAEWQNCNIVATQDGGANWDNISGSINSDRNSWNTPYFISRFNDNHLYAGTYKVYKNTSGPFDAWSPISPDLTDGTNDGFHVITTLDQSPFSGSKLYAGTSDARVWTTANDGISWTPIYTGLTNRNVSAVIASPNLPNSVFVSQSGYRNNDSTAHIYYSTNNGNTWTNIAGDLPALAINDIWVLANHQDSCVVVATDGGVYATKNLGQNWERVGTNMPLIPVFDLDYNPAEKRLIAATFARSMQTMEIDSIFKEIPNTHVGTESFSKKETLQIYPNPSQGVVHFSSEADKIKQILIYDFQGRIIKSIIVNKTSYTLDHFTSGTYIAHIICEKTTGTKVFSVGR